MVCFCHFTVIHNLHKIEKISFKCHFVILLLVVFVAVNVSGMYIEKEWSPIALSLTSVNVVLE